MGSKSKPPSRRAVMAAFGEWLDSAQWKMKVQSGEERGTAGVTIGDTARAVVQKECRYRLLADQYLGIDVDERENQDD